MSDDANPDTYPEDLADLVDLGEFDMCEDCGEPVVLCICYKEE